MGEFSKTSSSLSLLLSGVLSLSSPCRQHMHNTTNASPKNRLLLPHPFRTQLARFTSPHFPLICKAALSLSSSLSDESGQSACFFMSCRWPLFFFSLTLSLSPFLRGSLSCPPLTASVRESHRHRVTPSDVAGATAAAAAAAAIAVKPLLSLALCCSICRQQSAAHKESDKIGEFSV